MSPGGLLPNTTSIRLLTVEAGSGSDAIVTRLCVVDLDQAHADYEAISYTWGAPQAEHTITVDGKPVNIRINLQQALLRLRHSTQPRTLWCDYLCITQTDHVEKAQQVQMIGRIFGTATTVHVWLGEHADHSEELFRDWYHPPESEGVLQDLKRRLKSDDPAALAHKQAAAHRAQTWANLFQRPYWRRTWIIQGLRLARAITIHIGPDSLPWKDLISARFTPLGMHGPFDHLSLSPYLDSTSFDDPQFLLYASLSWISKFVAVPMKPLRKAPGHVIMDDWEKGPNDIFDIVETEGDKPIAVDYNISLPDLVLNLYADRYVYTQSPKHLPARVLDTQPLPDASGLVESLGLDRAACELVASKARMKFEQEASNRLYASRWKSVAKGVVKAYKKSIKDREFDELLLQGKAMVTHPPP